MNKKVKVSARKQKKIEVVVMLREKLARATVLFFADYQGLTHKQLEELRASLKKVKAEFLIAKNRLLKIALRESKNAALNAQDVLTHLEKALEKPTAAFLAYGDEIAPIKALAACIKTTQLPKIKQGMFGGMPASETEFKSLSTIPTREVLLATLAMRLQSPIYGLHHAMRWDLQRLVIALDQVKHAKPAH